MAKLEALNISIRRGRFVLRIDKWTVEDKEKVAVLGENGSGKTTLLEILSGNLKANEGCVLVDGKGIDRLNKKEKARIVSFLPQFSDVLFSQSVYDIVLLGRYPYSKGYFTYEDRTKTLEVLREFDLLDVKDAGYFELSGGQKRRVMIARSINQDTPINIFDEPFANLDIKHSLSILKKIKQTEKTIVASIHDINLAIAFFDRIVILKSGRVVFDGEPNDLDAGVLHEAYGVDFRSCSGRFVFI